MESKRKVFLELQSSLSAQSAKVGGHILDGKRTSQMKNFNLPQKGFQLRTLSLRKDMDLFSKVSLSVNWK